MKKKRFFCHTTLCPQGIGKEWTYKRYIGKDVLSGLYRGVGGEALKKYFY